MCALLNHFKEKTKMLKILMLTFFLINSLFANPWEPDKPWTVSLGLGMAHYQAAFSHDSSTAVGRLSFNYQLFLTNYSSLGIEAGLQSNNSMRLDIPQATIDFLGGIPIEAQIKPMLDALITTKVFPYEEWPWYLNVNGGAAFRALQINRDDINDLKQVSPELQLGLGAIISENMSINLLYQAIFNGNPNFNLNELTKTATINNIPLQQAVILSFSMSF